MLKLFAFLAKRSDMGQREFRDYYENNHVPLVCSLAGSPLVYKRNYLRRGDPLNLDGGGAIGFDVVTEQVFADKAAFQDWIGKVMLPGNRERIRADEEQFIDHSHYFAYVVDECETTGNPAL